MNSTKQWMKVVMLAGVVMILGCLWYAVSAYYDRSTQDRVTYTTPSVVLGEDVLSEGATHDVLEGSFHGTRLILEKVATPEKRQKGLSDRASLAPLDGMLFLFPREDYHAFWMKDMHVAIDIVWLNGQMQVVGWEAHVSPDTYPALIEPKVPVRNVLELDAGRVEALGLKEGDMLELFESTMSTR